jgi:hypothetical protein
MLVYEGVQNSNSDIYSKTTTNNGITWSAPALIAGSELNETRPRMIRDNLNTLWLFYELGKETAFSGFYQSDIVYSRSFDNGNNWSDPESFTQYRGKDFYCEITLLNNKPFISFTSGRDFKVERQKFQLYYGIADETVDNNAPPYVQHFEHTPETPEPFQPFVVRCYADDETGISSVSLVTSLNGYKSDTLAMFDDGHNGDSLANDGIFGIMMNDLNIGDSRTYSFILEDTDFNSAHLNGSFVFIPLNFSQWSYRMDVNKIKLPFDNAGVIAAVGFFHGGTFDNIEFLFSAGFFLSGYTNNELWGNGVASSARIRDYYPGKVGIPPDDPKNNIYVVHSSDSPFGQSWQDWRYAVAIGADFYDGNEDGIYNPEDLNRNGTWDLNEDRPDIFGDVTAWCVFNDGVPFEYRQFPGMKPQRIEIQQTIFASGYYLTGYIQNIIFFRYRIINKATVSPVMDDVIFGIWTDPDIGSDIGYIDDLVGSDTVLNSGIAYNYGNDPAYGSNPPAFITNILQGPVSYIPGETFIDVNLNGVYDEGIDTPLDTAYHFNGLFIGSESFPGAKNLSASSFVHFIQSHPTVGDPWDHLQERNFMTGKDKFGNYLDPCTWNYGTVTGVNCNDVNPLFWYSGDPVTNTGWINNNPADQRMMINTGPFQLKENEPIDIWIAYIVGRGSNALNSVTIAKDINQYALNYYKSNFFVLPSDVDDDFVLLTDYYLFQNYPNPFNPLTTIKYQVPSISKVSLKIYDVLGREIATLVNEEKSAGRYEVVLNASAYASGVYLYRLAAGSFSEIKKMLLIK